MQILTHRRPPPRRRTAPFRFADARHRPPERVKPLVAEAVLRAAEHLPRHDAALVRAVYGQGRRMNELAALMDVPASRLRARLRTLLRRIDDPTFHLVVRDQAGWPPLTRDIGRACFIHGLTIQEAATTLGLTYSVVRRRRAAILELALIEARSLRLERKAG